VSQCIITWFPRLLRELEKYGYFIQGAEVMIAFLKRIPTGLIILFIFSASACSSSDEPGNSKLPVNTKYENFTSIKVTPKVYVSAFSERLQSGEGRSEFCAYRTKANEIKQIFNKTYDSAYNARIEVHHNMQYSGQPIVLLKINNGASAETIEVFGIRNDEMVFLQSIEANGFDWHYQEETGKILLVDIPGSPGDQYQYYFWNKDHFEQVKPHT
jgi:hypothetical protein